MTSDRSVAVIGSGPAGFSCAHFLLRAGIKVVTYEHADSPGGLLTYGIRGFKLDKSLVERRFAILQQAGLELHLNCSVDDDVAIDTLLRQYDAIFLGVGATRGKRAGIPNEDHRQVFMSMEFLTNVQRRLAGRSWMERFGIRGKRVVVVGGGDTAMDCQRSAVREGAESVTCLYRRDENNMPGSAKEYHNAVEEGINFQFHEAPKTIVVDQDVELIGIDAINTKLGAPGSDGRQRVQVVAGSEHCLQSDVVIMALGFGHEPHSYLADVGLKQGAWGELEVDSSGRTSHEHIYAGGDCPLGADLVVTAAAEGRRVALTMISRFLD